MFIYTSAIICVPSMLTAVFVSLFLSISSFLGFSQSIKIEYVLYVSCTGIPWMMIFLLLHFLGNFVRNFFLPLLHIASRRT